MPNSPLKMEPPTLRDLSGQNALLINNRQTVEAALHDGDLVQFGQHGPLVRFRFLPNNSGPAKPWRYILEDSRDIVVRTPHHRYTSFLHLLRHIGTDIARYGSRTVKIVAALVNSRTNRADYDAWRKFVLRISSCNGIGTENRQIT